MKDPTGSETRVVDDTHIKLYKKFLQKMENTITYDQNHKMIYHRSKFINNFRIIK